MTRGLSFVDVLGFAWSTFVDVVLLSLAMHAHAISFCDGVAEYIIDVAARGSGMDLQVAGLTATLGSCRHRRPLKSGPARGCVR